MTAQELRKKFLEFFEKNDHVIIPSASLVPSEEEQLAGKEKVLFTSAGMQPLVPYLMGKPHPQGKRLADVQKCLRTDDIEEVGDAVHHTFFEMLGNWSLGDYWKEGAIELSFKFLREELNIPLNKLAISVFAGDEDAPRDEESANKWKSLGVSESRIAYLSKEANWWPTPRKDLVTGELKNAFGPCGSDTEMFIWTGESPAPDNFDPLDSKWVEVWNDVFMEFNRKADGTLEELPQKNVDTGMGFERMLAVLNGKDNDYETDLFDPLYSELIQAVKTNIQDPSKPEFTKLTAVRLERIRIFLDHSRAALFLIAEGVLPGKNERESVLRRLIRKANDQLSILGLKFVELWWDKSIQHYKTVYRDFYQFKEDSLDIIKEELFKYGEVFSSVALEKLTKEITNDENISKSILTYNLEKYSQPDIATFMSQHSFVSVPSVAAGTIAFDANSTLGVPAENILEITQQKLGQDLRIAEFSGTINILSKEHQERSRGVEAGKFKGGLAGHSETEIKYHTATHLLHQALRDVLGPQVFQKGSNIISERLRFDFSYDKKMTPEEIKKVEEIINKRIEEDLKVDHMIVSLDKAKKMNAIGLFNEKYADKVSIYGVGPNYKLDSQAKDQRDRDGYYSLEFCGGPHVEHTGVIGKIKITKEEAISFGIRRIRAQIV